MRGGGEEEKEVRGMRKMRCRFRRKVVCFEWDELFKVQLLSRCHVVLFLLWYKKFEWFCVGYNIILESFQLLGSQLYIRLDLNVEGSQFLSVVGNWKEGDNEVVLVILYAPCGLCEK